MKTDEYGIPEYDDAMFDMVGFAANRKPVDIKAPNTCKKVALWVDQTGRLVENKVVTTSDPTFARDGLITIISSYDEDEQLEQTDIIINGTTVSFYNFRGIAKALFMGPDGDPLDILEG